MSNVMREVYFGNLSPGLVDEEAGLLGAPGARKVMRELLEPAMHELPEFCQDQGPAITKARRSRGSICSSKAFGEVTIMAPGKYCFVQFQNAALATRAIAIFDDTELFGRRVKASRPSSLVSRVTENRPRGKYAVTVEPPAVTPSAVAAAGAAAAALLQPRPAPLAPELLQAHRISFN